MNAVRDRDFITSVISNVSHASIKAQSGVSSSQLPVVKLTQALDDNLWNNVQTCWDRDCIHMYVEAREHGSELN